MTRASGRVRARPARLTLTLYVAGGAPNSRRAEHNLKAALELVGRPYELELVDVLRTPERAPTAGILVTPTLVRWAPEPEQRLIGNLADRRALALTLDLEDPTDGEGA
jgi:hypothetical protein